jgi:hypothetical protein
LKIGTTIESSGSDERGFANNGFKFAVN